METGNMEITAVIKNARWENDHRAPNIKGRIYADSKGRFLDGEIVYTSSVLEDLGNGIFRTKNSIYKVEFEEGESSEFLGEYQLRINKIAIRLAERDRGRFANKDLIPTMDFYRKKAKEMLEIFVSCGYELR